MPCLDQHRFVGVLVFVVGFLLFVVCCLLFVLCYLLDCDDVLFSVISIRYRVMKCDIL